MRGFTMIELMISIGLFGLIAAGAMSLVMSGNRLQSHSARVDVAQSAVRAALDFMTRDIVSASSGAASGVMVNGSNGTIQLPISVTDNVVTAGVTSDKLDLWLADASGMATVVQTVSSASTQIVVDGVPASLSATSPLFMVTDLSAATLMNLTGTGTTTISGITYGTINVNAPINFPAGVTTYDPQTFVFPIRHVTYSINPSLVGVATGAAQNESMLMMDLWPNGVSSPQPLAEGVEDFQVALGFDNVGDGIITENGAAANDDEWVFNVAGETMPATLANLKMIRITIVAKATFAEGGAYSTRPQTEDHAAAAAADGFPRRVTRTQIAVRNFNL